MKKSNTTLSKILEEMKIDRKILDLNNKSNLKQEKTENFKPVEIKNNNFEINNNFYGSVNLESATNNINGKI